MMIRSGGQVAAGSDEIEVYKKQIENLEAQIAKEKVYTLLIYFQQADFEAYQMKIECSDGSGIKDSDKIKMLQEELEKSKKEIVAAKAKHTAEMNALKGLMKVFFSLII